MIDANRSEGDRFAKDLGKDNIVGYNMFRFMNWPRRCTVFAITFAVGISGSIAVAQEVGVKASESDSHPPLKVVITTTLRTEPTHTGIVTPVQQVSISASVRTDDLSRQWPADKIELQNRIRQTAHRLCDRMEFQYPVGIPDGYHCQEAVERSSDQIDTAIQNNGSASQIENP